jgi:hypothetical protein
VFSGLTSANGDKLYPRQSPTGICTSYCDNVSSAGKSCTNYDCLCPTVFQSAAACSSCLATVLMNGTQAADVASLLSVCANPDACVPQCHNVAAAASSCGLTNFGCLCPTIQASGPGCISCLQASHTNPTDAAIIAFYLATECVGITGAFNASAVSPVTSTTGSSASTSAVSVTLTSTSPPTSSAPLRSGSSSSSAVVASSGAWSPRFGAGTLGVGYIQMLVGLCMICLFSAFI